ncbi:MAG TPA: hypothetical protein VFV02_17935, partial [Acidimicrobiales bacterium]|nr:hypothetical protein [Acidimicrobiales bacterium]
YDRIGAELESLETEDLMASLHVKPGDASSIGDIAEEAGSKGDQDVLAYLLRRNQRRSALWETLLHRPRY